MKLKRLYYRFFHRTGWYDSMNDYNVDKLKSDIVAGIVVGVVALPLSLAFGIASGVTPEKGLITAALAGVVGAVTGGSRYLISGPTGAFIVVTSGVIGTFGVEGLYIATFMAGIILAVMGLFRLGRYIRFIPYPLIVGFNAGIALSIFTTQVKDFLGLSYHSLSSNFVDKWIEIVRHIGDTGWMSVVIGLITIGLITILPRFSRKVPAMLASILIVTAGCYVLRLFFELPELVTIGEKFTIETSFPRPQSLELNFEYFANLLPAALTIAVMGAIVTLMTATVMDGATGERHHSNVELISQGATNMLCALFGGIPSTGAIARTMTNIGMGGRSPISSFVHGLTVLVLLVFLGSFSRQIPVACLAGMLFVIAYNMSDWRSFRSILRSPRSDVYVLLTTFLLTVLVDLTTSISVGMFMAIFLLFKRVQESVNISHIKNAIDPTTDDELSHDEPKLVLPDGIEAYEIDGPFFFGIANRFEEMTRIIGDAPRVRILRMRRVPFIDSTALHNLELMIRKMREEKIHLILSGVRPEVMATLEKSRIVGEIGHANIFPNITDAVEYASKIVQE